MSKAGDLGGSDDNGGGAARFARWRMAMMTFFPMVIAVLSLVTSIYNGYLNNKFVTLIRGNLTRAEYMRTCRDVIDAYFQVKYRADVVARSKTVSLGSSIAANAAGASPSPSASAELSASDGRVIEAGNAVARFGALATYLANLRDDNVRARYTDLYWKLDNYVSMSASSGPAERQAVIREADAIFAGLNDDCVKSAANLP